MTHNQAVRARVTKRGDQRGPGRRLPGWLTEQCGFGDDACLRISEREGRDRICVKSNLHHDACLSAPLSAFVPVPAVFAHVRAGFISNKYTCMHNNARVALPYTIHSIILRTPFSFDAPDADDAYTILSPHKPLCTQHS